MDTHGVVPDVIDKEPAEVAEVKYGKILVHLGNELTPTNVQHKPSVTWQADHDSNLYTLCMIDPDVPARSNPKWREWQHWVVVNIKGNDVAKGDTLTEYVGAGPPAGSGLHRYVILVYKQPQKIDIKSIPKINRYTGEDRGLFSIKKFASKHGLGNPIAGNFFQAQWDDLVPILYKQMGLTS